MSRSAAFPPQRFLALAIILTALAVTACDGDPGDLALDDLTPGEHLYVERIVVLERAKAVALVERETGIALLDSLAAAWGDSSLAETRRGLSNDPARAAALGRLLRAILETEADSLEAAPRPDRLSAPLPVPRPEAATPPPGD